MIQHSLNKNQIKQAKIFVFLSLIVIVMNKFLLALFAFCITLVVTTMSFDSPRSPATAIDTSFDSKIKCFSKRNQQLLKEWENNDRYLNNAADVIKDSK